MTKLQLKREVIQLRLQGKSYSEIKREIQVSKGSLSLWLRNIQLTNEQLLGLKKKKDRAVERFRLAMKLKRQKRVSSYYKNQLKQLMPLTEKEIFVAGLFLYLGEGNKASRNSVSITNTDPSVIKFTLYWMINCLKVPIENIRVQLHLYSDMDIIKESNYWQKELGLNGSNFIRPYIKKSMRTSIDQKGFGHGTCGLWIHNTVLKENIMMAIRAITDNYSINPHKFDIID